jgi:hypothetical protein
VTEKQDSVRKRPRLASVKQIAGEKQWGANWAEKIAEFCPKVEDFALTARILTREFVDNS